MKYQNSDPFFNVLWTGLDHQHVSILVYIISSYMWCQTPLVEVNHAVSAWSFQTRFENWKDIYNVRIQ